jgi:flagellar basal body-associated protein FliL
MKKILIGAAIGIGVLMIIGIFIFMFILAGIGKTADVVDKEIKKVEQKQIDDKEKLKLENVKREGEYIRGEVTNTLGYKISYLEIGIKYMDKDKAKLSDDLTNTTDLEKGEKWKFEFMVFDKYDSYEIKINDVSNY